jgi:general secretion pathway protein C
MLFAIVQRWRSKLPEGLPQTVSICLVLLVAWELVRLATAIVLLARSGKDFADPRPELHTILPRKPELEIAQIQAAHLFGLEPPPAVDPNAPIRTTVANLVLTGTLAASDAKQGAAIISADGKSAFYQVGKAVSGAVVSSVFADRVILDRNGTPEALIMPRQLASIKDSAEHSAVASVPGGDNLRGIADVVRAGGTVNNAAGRVRGFRIYPADDRTTFGAVGLRGGDLVVAINGTPVVEQNARGSQDLFKTIAQASQATMTIERNGQTHDVTLDVAQAGTSIGSPP